MNPDEIIRRIAEQGPQAQQVDVPEMSMVLPGEQPAQWMIGPHPQGQKRMIFRLSRPGCSLMVELAPEDGLRLAAEVKKAAEAVRAGLILPPNGQQPGS